MVQEPLSSHSPPVAAAPGWERFYYFLYFYSNLRLQFPPLLALCAAGAQRCLLSGLPGAGAGEGAGGRQGVLSWRLWGRGLGPRAAVWPSRRSGARGGSAAGRGRTKEGGDEPQHNVPPMPPSGSGQGQRNPPAGLGAGVGWGCGEVGGGEIVGGGERKRGKSRSAMMPAPTPLCAIHTSRWGSEVKELIITSLFLSVPVSLRCFYPRAGLP